MESDGEEAEAEQHAARAMLKKEFSSKSLSLRQQSFRRSSVGSDWSEDDSGSVSEWGGAGSDGDGVGARRATGGLGPLERAGVLGKNLSEQLAERRAMRALGTRLSKMALPENAPADGRDGTTDGKPGKSGITAEMRRRFRAVADAAAFASYVRKQVAKRRAAKEALARLARDEPALRSPAEDAFKASETIGDTDDDDDDDDDDDVTRRPGDEETTARRISVPESAARSLPSLREGDEDEADEDDTAVRVAKGATRGETAPGREPRRRRGSIDYDRFRQPRPCLTNAGSADGGTRETFRWQRASRVVVATGLPPELFEDDDEAYDEDVLLACRTLRDASGSFSVEHAASRAAAPAANARDELRRRIRAKDPSGEPAADDEERAVRIATARVAAAKTLSDAYDANVRAARDRDRAGGTKPARPAAPKRPIYASRSSSRGRDGAHSRKNVGHYGKWFLAPELKSRVNFERDRDRYELLVGGEDARVERELRDAEAELGKRLAGSFGARAYKRWIEDTRSGSVPGYLESVEAAVDDGSAASVQRARRRSEVAGRGVFRSGKAPPLGEAPFASIGAVAASSPAAVAGLRPGDRIVSFGGLVGTFGAVTARLFGPTGLLEELRRADGTFAGEAATVWLMRDAKLRKVELTPRRWREGDTVDLLGCDLVPTPEGADEGGGNGGKGEDAGKSSRSSGFEVPRLDDEERGETLIAGLRPI